jgi:hypothetical protein
MATTRGRRDAQRLHHVLEAEVREQAGSNHEPHDGIRGQLPTPHPRALGRVQRGCDPRWVDSISRFSEEVRVDAGGGQSDGVGESHPDELSRGSSRKQPSYITFIAISTNLRFADPN